MTLEQLLRTRHAELPLFVVRMENTSAFAGFGDDAGKRLFREHLMYWWKLEEAGKLFAAGPVDFGKPNQSGMAIFIASSLDEAQKLAEEEPLHAAGWRVNTVHTWQLNEGLAVPATRLLIGPKAPAK